MSESSPQRSLQRGFPAHPLSQEALKILFKPTLWMFQRAQSKTRGAPSPKGCRAILEGCRTCTKVNLGETKRTLKAPRTSKSLAYKELHPSNTSSPSSAPDFLPSTSLVKQQELEFTREGKTLPRARFFHLPTPAPASLCCTRTFKMSPESSIFIWVGGRRSEMYFSLLSGFNYDQTFQSDEISQ